MLALITNVEPFQPIQLPTFIPSLRKRGWDIRVDPLALSRLFLGKLDLREAWKLIEIRLSFFFKSISSFFRFICCVIHQCCKIGRASCRERVKFMDLRSTLHRKKQKEQHE